MAQALLDHPRMRPQGDHQAAAECLNPWKVRPSRPAAFTAGFHTRRRKLLARIGPPLGLWKTRSSARDLRDLATWLANASVILGGMGSSARLAGVLTFSTLSGPSTSATVSSTYRVPR